MTNMWMVRAGNNSFLIDDFLKYNIVAIGWDLGNLSGKSDDEISKLYKKKYGNTNSLDQVTTFKNKISVDDYVVTANTNTRTFYVGKVISDYYRSDKISKIDETGDRYCDVHDVEWLGEVQKDSLINSTQKTLGSPLTVYNIKKDACRDILENIGSGDEIKQIRTVTLTKHDPDSLTYEDAVNFLSNVLFDEREGHFHYIQKNINLIGRTLVLFKYDGKLIGYGIFIDEAPKKVKIQTVEYNGYYLVEKGSVEIFKDQIDLNELKKYVPSIKSLSRDQVIDIQYLENINEMIFKHLDNNVEIEFSAKIIRNYLDENNLGSLENNEYESAYINFRENFAPESLENLEDLDILNKIFMHDGDKNNLCYHLEFFKDYKFAGSISGGSAYKFSLFKHNKTHQWTTGSANSSKTVSVSEAIEIGRKVRDAIVKGAYLIGQSELLTINDYVRLEKELGDIFSNCSTSHTNQWIHKYYTLLFPEKFPVVHWSNMKKDFLKKFKITPQEEYYALDGQLVLLAKNAHIKGYSLFKEEILDLFKEKSPFISDLKHNIIYFGAPGTGKSYNLNRDKDKLLENYPENYERVTFHPDYSYAHFVGTYKPVPDGDSITYRYVPGPFMRIIKKALDKPSEPYLLIIEEINRANVAAVFGDVFQLLDRTDDNESEYPIEASEDMKTYLDKNKIILPSNLFIWATMNSADQGVFPMDTAFKRRWDFRYFGINYNENKIENTHVIINEKPLYWNDLRKQINEELLTYKINEDKLIGPFFAFNEYQNQEIPLDVFKDIFKNKIIMYLFEDAARSNRNKLFSGVKSNRNITYSEICDLIDDDLIVEIFSAQIQDVFIDDEE